MNEVLAKIQKIGIVPVVVLNDAKDAKPLAEALCAGGLPCAEVTYRTEAAEESIKIMASQFPEMLVGAGTVLTIEQVDSAIAAGAKFIVSPGLNPTIVQYCIDKGIPITPGTSNPSDIEAALSFGLDVVKFFPAEASGGLNMIKAMAAPYTTVKFMPTGGINAKNINSYLAYDKILACGGSWMVKDDLIKAGEFDKIKELTKQAVQTMLGFELLHFAVSSNQKTESSHKLDAFAQILSVCSESTDSYVKGSKGCLTIGTNSVSRAKNYLESLGYLLDESSAKYCGDKLTSIYLSEENAGYAILLSQK